MSEHEAIIVIQHYLPQQIQVIHLYTHQDTIKGKNSITFPEKLNDLVDNIADTYARSPINNHILLTPLQYNSIRNISSTIINTTFDDLFFNRTQMNM